ncbi:MAG: hypothetical protein LBH24_03850 [Clostridiales bacterium]|jgi:predicted transcriptional regulator|nr:hypothetical protein [Clostridiales bacterium]
MTVGEVRNILNAGVLCGQDLLDVTEIKSACGADMMSDVLAFVKDQGMLLTGLTNPQVVRTAEMMDINCIVFVRGKTPDPSVVRLADDKRIILLTTEERMYPACGKLYRAGLSEGSSGKATA